jgi:hypothetical protein
MDPNEALLVSVESILDDDKLDDAGRNEALAETLKQFSDYTSPQAKVAILKRDDVEAEGEAGFDGDKAGTGDIRAKLRLAYEDQRRSYPNLSDETHLGLAWRSLSESERDAILAEDVGGEDPAFPHEKVDIGKLADFLLEVRAELIGKAQPRLTREQTMAAAIDERPDLFKLSRESLRTRPTAGNTGPTEAAVAARHFALQLLTAKAKEIRKAEPKLTIEAARVEARRRFPDIAARERA